MLAEAVVAWQGMLHRRPGGYGAWRSARLKSIFPGPQLPMRLCKKCRGGGACSIAASPSVCSLTRCFRQRFGTRETRHATRHEQAHLQHVLRLLLQEAAQLCVVHLPPRRRQECSRL